MLYNNCESLEEQNPNLCTRICSYDMADELQRLANEKTHFRMVASPFRLPFGALSTGFFLAERLSTIVGRYLPEDVSAAEGRLFISLTRQRDKSNRIVCSFPSRDYLLRCLSASCYIPMYSSGYYAVPPIIDDEVGRRTAFNSAVPTRQRSQTATASSPLALSRQMPMMLILKPKNYTSL